MGHHIDHKNDKKLSPRMKKMQDEEIESEKDYEEEGSQFMFATLFGMENGFNATHFMEQGKKRAHAIYSSMEYKRFNDWKHQLMDNL